MMKINDLDNIPAEHLRDSYFAETIMESGCPCHSFDSFAGFELVLQM